MPDETSARLWGLRAGGESLLRCVTRAQRCLEHYKEHDPDALGKLRHALAQFVREIDDLARDAHAAGDHLAELPERYARPPKAC